MLIIFVIFLTTIFAYSYEKYIDLLPDEKKQEFLDKVARRIIESVESNATSITSKELTDEQLNEHHSYIQSVMEQETEDFEAKSNSGDNKTSEEDILKNYSKDNYDSEESLGVKPLKLRDDDDSFPEADNADLTVTGMSRRSYDEISQDNLMVNSKIDNVTEDTLNLQSKSVTSNVKSDETTKASHIENSNEQGAFAMNSIIKIHKPNTVDLTTETQGLRIEDAFENNSQNITSNETSIPLSVTATSFTKLVENVPIETTMDSNIQILEDDSATDSNIIYVITENNKKLKQTTESHTQDSSDGTLTSPLTNESTTVSVIDLTSKESATQMTQIPELYPALENDFTVNNFESSLLVTESYTLDSSGSAPINESTTNSIKDMTTDKSSFEVTENDSTVNNAETSLKATEYYTQDSSDSNLAITADLVIDTISNESTIQEIQEPKHELKVHARKNDSTSNNSESSLRAPESYTKNSSDNSLINEITTYSVIDTNPNESAFEVTQEPELESEVYELKNDSTINSAESNAKAPKPYTKDNSDNALINESTTDSVIDAISNESAFEVTQEPEYESEVHELKNDSTVNSSESSSKAHESYTKDISDNSLINESTTDSVIDTTSNESAFERTQESEFKSEVHELKNDSTVNSSESNANTPESYTKDSSDNALINESTTDSVIDTTSRETAIEVTQIPGFASEVPILENDSTVNSSESSSKAPESYTKDNSDNSLINESTTYSVIDTTSNESAFERTQESEFKSEVHELKNNSTVNSSESNANTPESYTKDSSDNALINESTTHSVTDTISNESAIEMTQISEFASEVTVLENVSTVNNSESSSQVTKSYTLDRNDSILPDESTTNSVIDTTYNESPFEVSRNDFTVNSTESSSEAPESYTQDTSDRNLLNESTTHSHINTTILESAIQVIQKSELKPESHVHESNSTVNNSESSSGAPESYTQDSSDSNLTYKSTTNSVKDTTTSESTIQVTQGSEYELKVYAHQSFSKINSSETSSITSVSYTQDSRDNARIDESTTDSVVVTATNESAFKVTQGPEFVSDVHEPKNFTSANNSESSSKAPESYAQASNDSNLTYESLTDAVIDTTSHQSVIQVTQRPEYKLKTSENDSTVNSSKLKSETTVSYIEDSSEITLTDVSATDSTTVTTINENAIKVTQGLEFESEAVEPENDSTVINSEFYIQDNSASLLTSETNSAMDMTTKYESIHLSTTDNGQVFTTATQDTVEINTAENYNTFTEDRYTKEVLDTIIKTTTIIPILNINNIEEKQGTKESKDIVLFNTIKLPENDNLVSYIVSRALKKVKNELELKKAGEFIGNEVEINKGDVDLNNYPLYEISWPTRRSNQPFRRSQEPIKDQPYYVPVYKYSPNFAYYNPKNHLEPKEMEENPIKLDTCDLREENNEHKAEPSEFILQSDINAAGDFVTNPPERRDDCESNESCKATTTSTIVEETDENIEGNKDKTNGKKNKLRSRAESKVSIYMNVLEDMILDDSKALKQYDWLMTTVQIQSALTKILKLIKRMQQSDPIHPADLQILKYVVFLHNFSLEIKRDNKLGYKLRKKVKLLPKKKRRNKMLKKEGLINSVWMYLRTLLPDLDEGDGLSHLYKFLINVRDGLFDLHEAIKHIADVTKFDRQNWYGNLKHLYLSANEKHLRELLLHISMSRLVDLVEHSCKQGLDRDFIKFVETNKKDAARILEEIIFIYDIVDEIKVNMK